MVVGWLPDVGIQRSVALQKALMFRNLDIQRIRQYSRYITSKMEKHWSRGEGGEHSQFLPSSHPNYSDLGLLESSNCIDYESRATEGSEDV